VSALHRSFVTHLRFGAKAVPAIMLILPKTSKNPLSEVCKCQVGCFRDPPRRGISSLYVMLDAGKDMDNPWDLPVEWPAIKVPATCQSICRVQCSGQSAPTGSKMATRQISDYRTDPVLPPPAFPIKNGTAGVALAAIYTTGIHAGTEHYGSQQCRTFRSRCG
jgi:hypothetical protein